MASVTCSGAGPPLAILYLTPKSPFGPPGLWLADRTMPPRAACLRMTQDIAGVERSPLRPSKHAADAIGRGHAKNNLDGFAIVEPSVPANDKRFALHIADASKTDCMKFSR